MAVFGISLGVIVMTFIDYWIYKDEAKRYDWFKKLTNAQKLLVALAFIMILLFLNLRFEKL
ncbi:hypothetical protein M1K46_24455 [Fictibacillus sp. WQ 8-8]|uniref:hypothetical protein n=1 Tax=Fictibacillus sp. WQ 8-8 TaxID=2938788 RepID=UPI00210A857D|nr:hypothetical protein [Fictibacillus sp. WQ 8-8]MCQ6268729.1 hypothetical protein [Fictibacillus sp. WQ 8-8]